MLWPNTWYVIPRLTYIFETSKCLILWRCLSKKSLKADQIKRLRTEEKLLFGKLIENKKQKIRRLKLENTGQITKSEPSTSDSELVWMQNVSKLTPIKVPKTSHTSEVSNNEACFDLNCNSQDSETKKIAKNKSKIILDTTEQVVSDIKSELKKPNAVLVSKDIVNNIFQFSIFEKSKSLEDEWTDSCKTLSVSWAQNKSTLNYPTVTKILQATLSESSTQALEKWKLKMMEKLGVKGFELYQSQLLKDGKVFHAGVMNNLIDKPYEIPDKMKQTFLSLTNVFKNIKEVRAVESQVVHSKLFYRGILDCVAIYRDELCLVDWKKSDSAKRTISDTYDAPVQIASYIGASNTDLNYPFQIKKGIIVIAYTDGSPASVFEVSGDLLQIYWKYWLQRLQDYHLSSSF